MARRTRNYRGKLGQELREKYPDGEKVVTRGRKLYMLRDKETIDTSATHTLGSTEIKLELLSDQWQGSHDYTSNGGYTTSYGFLGGLGTTEETLGYLRKEKEQVAKRKRELDGLDKNLDKMIERIEVSLDPI